MQGAQLDMHVICIPQIHCSTLIFAEFVSENESSRIMGILVGNGPRVRGSKGRRGARGPRC